MAPSSKLPDGGPVLAGAEAHESGWALGENDLKMLL